jgi:hypothetical protein
MSAWFCSEWRATSVQIGHAKPAKARFMHLPGDGFRLLRPQQRTFAVSVVCPRSTKGDIDTRFRRSAAKKKDRLAAVSLESDQSIMPSRKLAGQR